MSALTHQVGCEHAVRSQSIEYLLPYIEYLSPCEHAVRSQSIEYLLPYIEYLSLDVGTHSPGRLWTRSTVTEPSFLCLKDWRIIFSWVQQSNKQTNIVHFIYCQQQLLRYYNITATTTTTKNFQFSRSYDLEFDLGRGHVTYHHASHVDCHRHSKFHSHQSNLL